MNSKCNFKKFKKLNYYYNNILLVNPIAINKNIYNVGYPIFYKEAYYFWLKGITYKITKRSNTLNEILHFKSSLQKIKFTLYIPTQLPYLLI